MKKISILLKLFLLFLFAAGPGGCITDSIVDAGISAEDNSGDRGGSNPTSQDDDADNEADEGDDDDEEADDGDNGDGDGDDDDGDSDGDDDDDTSEDEVDNSQYIIKDPEGLILGRPDYEGWEEADESWAPGEITSFVNDNEDHTGYLEARCWECHSVGMPDEPVDHDPRMQTWAWSCARGFPGTTCHGHGYNGCYGFNHADDPAFFGCTLPDCHDQHDGDPWYENHGFDNAPDAFCNSCHASWWNGWPDDIFGD
jgi:hypothetical protein